MTNEQQSADAQSLPETSPSREPVSEARASDASIATPEEVLAILTNLLRGDKAAEQLRAAEHLAKHYGMLNPREDRAPVKAAIAGEIEAALRSLEEARHGQDSP